MNPSPFTEKWAILESTYFLICCNGSDRASFSVTDGFSVVSGKNRNILNEVCIMNYVSDLHYGVSLYRDGLFLDTYYFDDLKKARIFARNRSRASRVSATVFNRFLCDADGYAHECFYYYGGCSLKRF